MERASILSRGNTILPDDLPKELQGTQPVGPSISSDLSLKQARRALEIEMIQRALDATDGNRTHAARELGISHRALLYKLKEYGLGDRS